MNKLELFNKLKSEGKIPDNLTVDMVTEQYLLSLDLKPETATVSNPTAINMDEMKQLVYTMFDDKVKALGIDSIDTKYMKLPGAELTADQTKGLSEKQIKNLQMRNFLKGLGMTKDSFFIQPDNTLALNTNQSGAVGSYTIPVEFMSEVSRLTNLYGAFRRNARYRTFNSKTSTMPKLSATPSGAYRTNDSTAFGESNMTFGQITFTANDYGFISGLSRDLLDDTGVNLIELLSELVATDFAANEDAQGFLGTSALFTGLAEAITDSSYIATTSGSAASTLTLANLISIVTMPKSKALARDPKWYFHKTILGLILAFVDSAGRPIFSEVDKFNILSSRRFMGYPYELSDGLNINQDSASKPIVFFGDLYLAATYAERQGIEMSMSTDATVGGNSAFASKLVFYRFDTRNDFQIEQETACAKIVTHA